MAHPPGSEPPSPTGTGRRSRRRCRRPSRLVVSITIASSAAPQRRDRATGVDRVTPGDRAAFTVVDLDRPGRGHLVALTAPGPLVVARSEEHLDRRVREHDGADVAALHDATAVLARPTLAGARRAPRAPPGARTPIDTAAVTSGPRISALTSRPSSSDDAVVDARSVRPRDRRARGLVVERRPPRRARPA